MLVYYIYIKRKGWWRRTPKIRGLLGRNELGDVLERECLKRTNWLHIEIWVALSKGFPSNRDFDWMKVKKREKLSLSL